MPSVALHRSAPSPIPQMNMPGDTNLYGVDTGVSSSASSSESYTDAFTPSSRLLSGLLSPRQVRTSLRLLSGFWSPRQVRISSMWLLAQRGMSLGGCNCLRVTGVCPLFEALQMLCPVISIAQCALSHAHLRHVRYRQFPSVALGLQYLDVWSNESPLETQFAPHLQSLEYGVCTPPSKP